MGALSPSTLDLQSVQSTMRRAEVTMQGPCNGHETCVQLCSQACLAA